MTKPHPSLYDFRRLHVMGGCVARARLIAVLRLGK